MVIDNSPMIRGTHHLRLSEIKLSSSSDSNILLSTAIVYSQESDIHSFTVMMPSRFTSNFLRNSDTWTLPSPLTSKEVKVHMTNFLKPEIDDLSVLPNLSPLSNIPLIRDFVSLLRDVTTCTESPTTFVVTLCERSSSSLTPFSTKGSNFLSSEATFSRSALTAWRWAGLAKKKPPRRDAATAAVTATGPGVGVILPQAPAHRRLAQLHIKALAPC
mmetsp:Transcript_95749/g.166348  ORF Transcript_95749/g.166348 Transcript_95749/m.166348 type:complete len:216 (-) Transcript_95749:8-655(-)